MFWTREPPHMYVTILQFMTSNYARAHAVKRASYELLGAYRPGGV